MKAIFFTYRSRTRARQGLDVLERGRISAWLEKTPGSLSQGGCGYCIRVDETDSHRASALLRAGGAEYSRSYRLTGRRFQEVAL